MLILLLKLILFLFGMIILEAEGSVVLSVVSFLCALIITALCQYFGSRRFTLISVLLYFCLSMVMPIFRVFIPLLCFDLFLQGIFSFSVIAVIPIIMNILNQKMFQTVLLILLIVLSLLLQYMYEQIKKLTEDNKRIRDSGTEQNRLLEQKNKSLMDKQDYEIHLAALNERNRIAREIHDNVGHIITRSILQTGAFLATCKDEISVNKLSEIKDTLTLAMNSIRGSVHDLKDDSVNLYDEINKILEPLTFKVSLEYDAPQNINKNIKYCFLAVLKEAITNITKHSDASHVQVAVREHPAIYQLLIHDNGTKEPTSYENGIGLLNIKERVNALNGSFSFSYQKGFRIFISIPKLEEHN